MASVLTCVLLIAGCSSGTEPPTAERPDAVSAARYFLTTYVEPDGRVVRPDQDGTTVSEGQAYAMLLAQVVDDDATFDRVWQWARDNLRGSDGLLAYLADEEGVVIDPAAASDADLIAAWALLREDDPEYQQDGRDLAGAVLGQEVAEDESGAPVLLAGPWAVPEQVVNPSYWTLPAYRGLDQAGSDPRWEALRERSIALLREFSADGRLPPDWGRMEADMLQATGRPDDVAGEAAYGLDAQRTLVWLAVDCDPRAREVAASYWPLLQDDTRSRALALALDGAVRDDDRHPLPLVAAAAAAAAAGEDEEVERLLAAAVQQDVDFPTYYGAVWVALGRALLQTDELSEC